MCRLEDFICNLQQIIIDKEQCEDNNIIRKHSVKLEQLGDLSFPLSVENWHHLLTNTKNSDKIIENEQELVDKSKEWHMKIAKYRLIKNDLHIFFERIPVYKCMIRNVLDKSNFGASDIFQKEIKVVLRKPVSDIDIPHVDLTTLRSCILRDFANNLVNFCSNQNVVSCSLVHVTLCSIDNNDVLCGPVLNKNNLKTTDTAQMLYSKRTSDMRLMAQHKYGMRVESNLEWTHFLEKAGKAAVTIEMLSHKPSKSSKIVLDDLRSCNKGAPFVMYNCARLSTLFREFEKRISEGKYPNLPDLDSIDFSLLIQPEEWELMYVYILQFPLVVKRCIKDIEKGILNPQYLITFLSNLASAISVYYRRVKILTDPRDHLFATIYVRIYLLKALERVYHNALKLLDIEPIKRM